MRPEDIDYHPDSGAGDGMDSIQDSQHPSTETASGDEGATTFEPSDARPAKRARFSQLRKRHHEHWDKNGKEQNDTNVAYDARMVCNRLELTDYQQSRALKLIEKHRASGHRYELTIMAVVTYVLNKEDRWIQRPLSEDEDVSIGDPLHSEWKDLLDTFQIMKSTVQSHVSRITRAESDDA